MVAFLSIALSLALLGLTIYGLHRFQSEEVKLNADRTMPLPPLQNVAANIQTEATPVTQAETDIGTEAKQAEQKPVTAGTASRLKPDNWLARVSVLKKKGEYDRALELCTPEFPLWSAYNQACILYRAKIKLCQEAGQPFEDLLSTLYRTAAQAEMLHEVTSGSPKLRLEQLRSLDISRLNDLEFPYQDIGYTQLRLVRKHDIKMMLKLWGRPRQHSTPRQLHESTWQSMRTAIT